MGTMRNESKFWHGVILSVLLLLVVVMVFPFYTMLIISVAPYNDVAFGQLYLLPTTLDFTNYHSLLQNRQIYNAFQVSLFNVVLGTTLSMTVTLSAAYALVRKDVPGRAAITLFFIIPMYFSGGMIADYLIKKDLGLIDNLLVMTLPICFSMYNTILVKNYFSSIPDSLYESARIDGANELRIMLQIILPCALPIIATVGLFYAVMFWNEWYSSMMFIQKRTDLITLQLLLRKWIIEATLDQGSEAANALARSNTKVYAKGLQMAAIVIATIPVMCVYPFVQRYFTTGIMLGAVKS